MSIHNLEEMLLTRALKDKEFMDKRQNDITRLNYLLSHRAINGAAFQTCFVELWRKYNREKEVK